MLFSRIPHLPIFRFWSFELQVARWQVARKKGKWGIPEKNFQNVAQLSWNYLHRTLQSNLKRNTLMFNNVYTPTFAAVWNIFRYHRKLWMKHLRKYSIPDLPWISISMHCNVLYRGHKIRSIATGKTSRAITLFISLGNFRVFHESQHDLYSISWS